ncbi:unnamed protein product, partial [Brassica oleracea]
QIFPATSILQQKLHENTDGWRQNGLWHPRRCSSSLHPLGQCTSRRNNLNPVSPGGIFLSPVQTGWVGVQPFVNSAALVTLGEYGIRSLLEDDEESLKTALSVIRAGVSSPMEEMISVSEDLLLGWRFLTFIFSPVWDLLLPRHKGGEVRHVSDLRGSGSATDCGG